MAMLAVCPAGTTSKLQEGRSQGGGKAKTKGNAQYEIPDAKSIMVTASPAISPGLRYLRIGYIEGL